MLRLGVAIGRSYANVPLRHGAASSQRALSSVKAAAPPSSKAKAAVKRRGAGSGGAPPSNGELWYEQFAKRGAFEFRSTTVEEAVEMEALLDEMSASYKRGPHHRFWNAAMDVWSRTNVPDPKLKLEHVQGVVSKMQAKGVQPDDDATFTIMNMHKKLKTPQDCETAELLFRQRLAAKADEAVDLSTDAETSTARDKTGTLAHLVVSTWANLDTAEGAHRAERFLLEMTRSRPTQLHDQSFVTAISAWCKLSQQLAGQQKKSADADIDGVKYLARSMSDNDAVKYLERAQDLLDVFVHFSATHSKTWDKPTFQPLRVSFHTTMAALTRLGTSKGVEKAEALLARMVGFSAKQPPPDPSSPPSSLPSTPSSRSSSHSSLSSKQGQAEKRLSRIASPDADSFDIVLLGWANLKTAEGGLRANSLFESMQPHHLSDNAWIFRARAWVELGTTRGALMTQQVLTEALDLGASPSCVHKVAMLAMGAWKTAADEAPTDALARVEGVVQLLEERGIKPDMMTLTKVAETMSSLNLTDKLFALLDNDVYIAAVSHGVEAGQDTAYVLPPFLHAIRRMRDPRQRRERLRVLSAFASKHGVKANHVSMTLLLSIPENGAFIPYVAIRPRPSKPSESQRAKKRREDK